MAIKVWIGEDYEFTHEAQAVATFVGNMTSAFGADEKVYHILCNFLVDGNPLDAAVVKSDGIVVLELKDVGGPVFGRENGPWFVTATDGRHELKGGRHGNPYLQARNYRFALLDLLKLRSDDFMNQRPERVAFQRCTSAIVAFSPSEQPGTDIKVGAAIRWFAHAGIDRLHESIVQRTTPGINLTNKEMLRFIKSVLRLQEAHMVGDTPRRPAHEGSSRPSGQPTQTDKPAGIKPDCEPLVPEERVQPAQAKPPLVIELGHESPGLNEPIQAFGQPAQAESPGPEITRDPPVLPACGSGTHETNSPRLLTDTSERYSVESTVVTPATPVRASPVRCVVCAVGRQPACDVARLEGKVVAVDETVPALVVDVSRHGEVRVSYEPASCQDVVESLRIIRARLAAGQPVPVAFWHLQREALGLKLDGSSLFILEPDWLVNVTDLTEVVYCPRKMVVGRYATDAPGDPAILGNAVHHAFRDVWQGADRATCMRSVRRSLASQSLAMVVNATVPEDIIDAAEPHIDKLLAFVAGQHRSSVFRSETFVLSPRLGLKGRIDGVWERETRPVMVGELKTGKSFNGSAREEHMLQVGAYAFMLIVRGEADPSQLRAILMYSGDPDHMMYAVELSADRLRRVIAGRNSLVRLELSGDAPFASNTNRCFPCALASQCRHLALLAGHVDNRPPSHVQKLLPKGDPHVSDHDRNVFEHYASLLAKEFSAAKAQHSALWTQEPGERAENGKALALDSATLPQGEVNTETGEYTYLLAVRLGQANTSDLRPPAVVLLSGDEGPKAGRIATAKIVASDATTLMIRMSEELLFSPAWADEYVDESLTERMFAGVFRFCTVRPHLSAILFSGHSLPSFSRGPRMHASVSWRDRLGINLKQIEAVERSLSADHFLLVNGPPGSGKTRLIASMVLAQQAEGHRVLVVTYTNRALDQALADVADVVPSASWIRLGSPLSATNEHLRLQTIDCIVGRDGLLAAQNCLLHRTVVGGTISTLLSGSYGESLGEFDLVIVDEATQATIPATLGAVSFGKRFVLIGDPRQLPPVVQSKTSDTVGEEGKPVGIQNDQLPALEVSLFEHLWKHHKETASVSLNQQYRMNEVICAIPSAMWYDPEIGLQPANEKTRAARLGCTPEWKSQSLASLLDPSLPFLFVDVSIDPVGRRTNNYEAELASKLILQLSRVTSGIAAPLSRTSTIDGAVSVAVISPYRAQVARIRDRLVEKDPTRAELWRDIVDTVDRFQGSQADVVIISLSPYTETVADHIANPRRLNVAMTRARHKLIVMGCRSHLERSELFARLFSECDRLIGAGTWCQVVEP